MSRRLNIAMVAACPFPSPRGTPVRIHRMAEALAHRGHSVHVVTYHLGRDVRIPNVQIHRIGNVPFVSKIKIGPSFAKLVLDLPLFFKTFGMLLRK